MVVDERGTFRQDSFQKAVAALSDAAAEAAGAGAGARPRSRGPGAPGRVPAGSRSVASAEAAGLPLRQSPAARAAMASRARAADKDGAAPTRAMPGR